MAKPKQLFWIGDRDADGRPLEFFGGMPGIYDPIPARDLSEEETAALTEAQLACIDSPTGKRLYRRTEPETRDPISVAMTPEAPPANPETEKG